MAREAGHTQGFGRVSPETRPSPYSPLHYRASPQSREAGPKRRSRPRGRRWPLAAGVAAVIIGGLVYAILFRTPAAPTRAVVVSPVPAAPAPATLNDEAQRLSRSAIAAPRR
jgi:hypothetical protein